MATLSATHEVASHPAASVGGSGSKAVTHVLGQLRQALEVRRQRKALLALDDRMLADVGLSKADVYREAHRPFLDLPGQTPRGNTW